MSDYISPILGVIDGNVYEYVIRFRSNYDVLLSGMRDEFGYGALRTGVLFTETEFKEHKSILGQDLVNILLSKGINLSNAINITKLFSNNYSHVKDLFEKGISLNDVVYGIDYKGRLKELGLVSSTTLTKAALEDVFTIYSLLEIPEEEEEIPEYIPEEIIEEVPEVAKVLWHPFLAGILISCDTWDDRKKRRTIRAIEARGRFEARKELVLPVLKIDDEVVKLLEEYVMSIESDGAKNYEILMDECSNLSVALMGIDLLKEQPDIPVDQYTENERITEIKLEIYDVNYKKLRDTRIKRVVGKWWKEYE